MAYRAGPHDGSTLENPSLPAICREELLLREDYLSNSY
jgi:hypothetical protein